MSRTTKQDKVEFRAYVRGLTNRQVEECFAKESMANRGHYAQICVDELNRRGL